MAPKRKRSTQDPPDHELEWLASELDLTALTKALPDLLENAQRQSMSYTDFSLALLRTEWQARRERKLARGLKRSHLGAIAGLEDFDFSLRPQLEPRVVKELLNCAFVEENRNIICIGKPGLGKTRIAKALAHAACLRGYAVLFTTVMDMLDDLHASLADGAFKRTFGRYAKPAVIVADEMGYQGLDSVRANYLYRLVSARHGRGAIIITANVGFAKWSSFFPSDSQAAATVDRLLDRATILRFSGKSFRQPKDIHGAPLDE
jgi:DNA replication protein DnaC